MKQPVLIIVLALGLLIPGFAIAQTAAADNKVSQSITFHAIPAGPQVPGVFQGRPPCKGLVTQLGLAIDAGNPKLKCNLVLHRNAAAGQPGNYTLNIVGGGPFITEGGNHYRRTDLEGEWDIVKGIPGDNNAEVYRLQIPKTSTYVYLLKGDDNVLFVLDENKRLLTGDGDFSYTLNRVELVAGIKP